MRARSGIVSVAVTSVTGTYKDVADFSFTVESWTDALSGPARTFATANVPGNVETVKLSTSPTVKPGEIQIVGTVTGATKAAMLTSLRQLKGWAVRAVALKLLALDANTFVEVDQVGAPVVHFSPNGVHPAARVTLTFQALKPYWQSTSLSAVTFTGSATDMPIGEAPSRPVIRLTGAYTNPTVTYKNSAGSTVGSFTLTVTLANAAHYVEIDCARRTIVHNTGSDADGIALLTAGDFIALDPADADTLTPDWGTLAYTVTAGTVSSATATYRANYW